MIGCKWLLVPSLCLAFSLASSSSVMAAKKHAKVKSNRARAIAAQPVMSKTMRVSKHKAPANSGHVAATSKSKMPAKHTGTSHMVKHSAASKQHKHRSQAKH